MDYVSRFRVKNTSTQYKNRDEEMIRTVICREEGCTDKELTPDDDGQTIIQLSVTKTASKNRLGRVKIGNAEETNIEIENGVIKANVPIKTKKPIGANYS